MKQDLEKLDTKALSVESDVSIEDAQKAIEKSGIQFDLLRWANIKTVGRHLVGGTGAHILVDSTMTAAQVRQFNEYLNEIAGNQKLDPEVRIAAINAGAKLISAGAQNHLVQLKAAEITGTGTKNNRRHNIAPQVHADHVVIQQDNRTVNIEKPE